MATSESQWGAPCNATGLSASQDWYCGVVAKEEVNSVTLLTRSASALILLSSAIVQAQQPAAPPPTTEAQAPTRDTSYIDAQGTAHITRIVPVPKTISPEAQRSLSRQEPDQSSPEPLAERRKRTDAYTAGARVAWSRLCPNQLVDDKIAGVPVHIVTPDGLPEASRDKVLLNLHGGGFNSDSGSYTESIPIASYSKIKVVAVLYRLAPEHPFPAAVDDSVAVYKELLKTYKPNHIVIYGTSAGAILTAEVAARLKQLGLPLPAALGIFSGLGDFSRNGDSEAMYGLRGLSGHLDPPDAEVAMSRNTQFPPTCGIRCSRRSSPTCAGCRLRCSLRAAAICCSPAPSTCTAPITRPASMRG